MNNFEELISKRISATIRQTRIKQNISQKELAAGICSQGMISSIEHGEYIPNTAIFLALCNRLDLSIDQNFLKEKLIFDNNSELTDIAFKLCSEHKYRQLIKYLDQQLIIASLNTNLDFQTYYYYYGCAIYQVEHDLLSCQHYFELAISYSLKIEHLQPKNSIELLLINSLGVVYAELNRFNDAKELFKIVNDNFASCKDADSENLNVITYQQACVFIKEKQYQLALSLLLTGLNRINQLNSTFMLSNYTSKILECYQKLDTNKPKSPQN